MAATNPGTRAEWTAGQKVLAGLLTVAGLGIAVPTFWSIFRTVYRMMRPYLGNLAWAVPVSGEILFVVAFGCGVLLAWRKAPPGAARGLIMSVVAAVSVTLQVYAGRRAFADALGHLAIVLAFFGVILIGKSTIVALAGGKVRADRIPFVLWVAAPARTFFVQRRKWLLGETSWKRMSMIEDGRRYALDLTRHAGTEVPGLLAQRIRQGRLPAPVLAAIDAALEYDSGTAPVEAAVLAWVASQMTLPEQLSAGLQSARQEVAQSTAGAGADDPPAAPPGTAPVVPPSRPSAVRPELSPDQVLRRVRRLGRKATDDDIKVGIRALMADGSKVTLHKVTELLPVGDRRGGPLLAEVLDERRPNLALAAGGGR